MADRVMMSFFSKGLPFYKMHGCGNDFIFVDNRLLNLQVHQMGLWAKKLCQKRFGICADGFVVLDLPPAGTDLAYIWHFFNSDGSRGEMCGNAARCAARLAYEIGLAPAEHSFGTIAGSVKATVIENGVHAGEVRVQLPSPEDVRLNVRLDLGPQGCTVHHVTVGVPHAVVFTPDVNSIDVVRTGRRIRHHHTFAPRGVNVDFVQVVDRQTLRVRTYERGVEDETFACGTGAAAAQFISRFLGHTGDRSTIQTLKGFDLDIDLKGNSLYLQGPVELTFKGDFYLTLS